MLEDYEKVCSDHPDWYRQYVVCDERRMFLLLFQRMLTIYKFREQTARRFLDELYLKMAADELELASADVAEAIKLQDDRIRCIEWENQLIQKMLKKYRKMGQRKDVKYDDRGNAVEVGQSKKTIGRN